MASCTNGKFFPGLVLFPRNNTFFLPFADEPLFVCVNNPGLNFCIFTPLGMMKDFCFRYTDFSMLADLEMMAFTKGCINQVRKDKILLPAFNLFSPLYSPFASLPIKDNTTGVFLPAPISAAQPE